MSQLHSKAVSKTVDLVSEGEIGGLLVGAKSIYLDGTPLQDTSGTDNFEGVTFNDDSKGTNTQSYLPGYPGVESTVSVNLRVKKGAPGAIEKTIIDSNLDAIRVTLFFPALSEQDEDKLVGTAVAFKIYFKKDDVAWNDDDVQIKTPNPISGKATQRFEKSYRLDIPARWQEGDGFNSITVKVERTTDDSTSDKITDVMYWGSYTKIIYNKLRYPNSALVGMTFNAEQFSSIPTRGYEIKGIKVKVPSNYTPYDPGHCSIGGYRRKDTCVSGGGVWSEGSCSKSKISLTLSGANANSGHYEVILSSSLGDEVRKHYFVTENDTTTQDITTRLATIINNNSNFYAYSNLGTSTLVVISEASWIMTFKVHSGEVEGTIVETFADTETACDAISGAVWTNGGKVGDTLYNGSWDGTFVTKWTCNPAWILYDICTKERYGLGKWLEAAQLDKWALYEIAKYCDAVDDDGKFVGVDSGWGPVKKVISGATRANPIVITTTTAHELENGDIVSISGVVGMTELNGNSYTVAGKTSTTFQLSSTNGTGYTTYTSGGTVDPRHKEARFTCHLYLQTRQEAFKVLNDIAAVFRGLIYWQEGLVTPVQDAPKDAIMNFSEANVIGGSFVYEGSSKKQRHNVALVTWNNPEELYKQNVEYVEDAEGIALANYQIVSKSITALGCTSQSQARRIGKWLLYSEKFETEICTFKTGMEATGLRPGNIIKVADPTRSSRRYGGRVSSGSTVTSVNLDNAVPITQGETYKLALVNTEAACVRSGVKQSKSSTTTGVTTNKLIDSTATFDSSFLGITITDAGSNTAIVTAVDSATQLTLDSDIMSSGEAYTYYIPNQSICLNAHVDNEWKPYTWVEQKTVTNGATGTQDFTTLAFTTAEKFTNLPTSTHMWILEEMTKVEAQEFRVLAIRESEPNIYDVSSLKYHSGKFTSIEDNIDFSAKSISSLPDPASAVPIPTSLEVHEELYLDSRGTVKNRATFSWQAPAAYPYIVGYYVEWRRSANDEWISLGETTSTSVTIDDAPAGTVQFQVKTKRVY